MSGQNLQDYKQHISDGLTLLEPFNETSAYTRFLLSMYCYLPVNGSFIIEGNVSYPELVLYDLVIADYLITLALIELDVIHLEQVVESTCQVDTCTVQPL